MISVELNINILLSNNIYNWHENDYNKFIEHTTWLQTPTSHGVPTEILNEKRKTIVQVVTVNDNSCGSKLNSPTTIKSLQPLSPTRITTRFSDQFWAKFNFSFIEIID